MDSEVIGLGILQGITEFLPVSSSGHLSLFKILFGIKRASLSFDLVLHISTLLAVVVYFARDIAKLFIEWLYGFLNANARTWAGWRMGWAVIIGTLVTAPIGLMLKSVEHAASSNILWLGGNFWITGILLLTTKFFRPTYGSVQIKDGLIAGIAQGVAVLPGISRSGSTICAGLLSGLAREDAFRFSFMLSIPAIVGATILEAKDLGGYHAFISDLPTDWGASSIAAFLSGIFSLVILKRLVTSDRWWMFSLYCILLGTTAVVFSIIGI